MFATVCGSRSQNISFNIEFKCVICGRGCQPTVPPKVISENLDLSNSFCNLYDINSTVCRLDIESIFQNSRLCSNCHEEITQVEALHSQIEILKRQIQSIKLSYDLKLREFKVNSGAVGTVEDEAEVNHEKLCNYAFHCNMPVPFIMPNTESEVPASFSGSASNYLQLPDQDVESLAFDFEDASGLDFEALDTDNDLPDIKSEFISENSEDSKTVVIRNKSVENSSSLNMAALHKKFKLKNLSVRVENLPPPLEKKVSKVRKRIRSKPNEIPKVKRRKIKSECEARHVRFPFACPHPGCSRRYSEELQRDGHQKSAHQGISQPFQCRICNRNFTVYPIFKKHTNICGTILTFKCLDSGCGCGKEYPTKAKLQAHIARMQCPKNIVCEICGKPFCKPWQYENHLRSHTKETPFECDICGKSYALKSSLRDHRFTHPELNLDGNKCKYCGKKFVGTYYLSLHERSHTGNFRFKCEICNYVTSAKSRFALHLTIHSDVRNFECDVCQHKFKDSSHLKQHKRLYHPATKEFTCVQCGKQFGNKKYLDRHEEIHKLIKKFQCTLCEKTFAQNTSYKYHMRHTHNVDGNHDKSK